MNPSTLGTYAQKDKERKELAAKIKEYLDNGGKITKAGEFDMKYFAKTGKKRWKEFTL